MRVLDVIEYIMEYEDVVGARPESVMVHPENYAELEAEIKTVAKPGGAKPGDMRAAMEVTHRDGNVAIVSDEDIELHSIRAIVPEPAPAE